jgi:hypothetical protein
MRPDRTDLRFALAILVGLVLMGGLEAMKPRPTPPNFPPFPDEWKVYHSDALAITCIQAPPRAMTGTPSISCVADR